MLHFLTTPQHDKHLAAYVIGCIVVFVLILFAIHQTPASFKKRLTMALAFLGGAFYIAEFLLPAKMYLFRNSVELDSPVVDQVRIGGPADKAGLIHGDVIVSVDKQTSEFAANVDGFLRAHAGSSSQITVLRNGAQVNLTLNVPPVPAPGSPAATAAHLYNENGTPRADGFLKLVGIGPAAEYFSAQVLQVKSATPAGQSGLRPGDVIIKAGGRKTPCADDVEGVLFAASPGKKVPLTVLRNGTQTTLSIVPPILPDPKSTDGQKSGLYQSDGALNGGSLFERLGLSVQFLITNHLSDYNEPMGNAQNIWLSLALVLGVVNLFRINGRLVMRHKAGWHNGLVFFIGFFAMLTCGMVDYYQPHRIGKFLVTAHMMGQFHGWYGVLFNGAFNALGATSFSLLAFYIVSAAYRSFRVRSPEAILLLCSALIMMLGLTPLGTKFITGFIPLTTPEHHSTWAFLKLENVSEWILMVLNGAAQRALLFGVAVGQIATSLRIWLSLERGQFFDAEV
jgi:membrane-associated protease RseP (regulator of RpoE activity)